MVTFAILSCIECWKLNVASVSPGWKLKRWAILMSQLDAGCGAAGHGAGERNLTIILVCRIFATRYWLLATGSLTLWPQDYCFKSLSNPKDNFSARIISPSAPPLFTNIYFLPWKSHRLLDRFLHHIRSAVKSRPWIAKLYHFVSTQSNSQQILQVQ